MIATEIKKFMALEPLMLPELIDRDHAEEIETTEEYVILYFPLAEPFLIGCVMDMLDDDMDLQMLYHGTKNGNSDVHHCCFFATPKPGQSKFKININTNEDEMVKGVDVTIYDDFDKWADDLESDLNAHSQSFDFIEAMSAQELISLFCKMSYDTKFAL